MAGHYMDCAANTDLIAGKKLVLMCIADDADKQSRVAAVGLDEILKWSGLKRSRALQVIAELVDAGYLLRHAAGRIGRYAEFVVFPGGCCPLHGPVPGYEPPQDDGQIVDQDDNPAADAPQRGSGLSDPQDDIEGPEEGPEEGPTATGPLPTELLNKEPPKPPGQARGAKCPHGRRTNCRRCGTNPRAAEQRERLAAAAAAAAEVARIERERDELPWCGDPDCNREDRWRSPDGGRAHRCPDCHPDVVVGRPTAEQLQLAAHAAAQPRAG